MAADLIYGTFTNLSHDNSFGTDGFYYECLLGLLVYVDHVQEIFMATYENIRERKRKKERKMHAIEVKNRGNNSGKCEHLKKVLK